MLILPQILSFLPWCMAVNVSLNVLGILKKENRWLREKDVPFDFGASLGRMRLFGDSVTWFGLVVTFLFGVVAEIFFPGRYLFLEALCVFFGDTVGSFIKRRAGFARGEFFPFLDHGDYALVAGAALLALGRISFSAFLAAYAITLIVTPPITYLAYRWGLRESAL